MKMIFESTPKNKINRQKRKKPQKIVTDLQIDTDLPDGSQIHRN
jgi:hypothetical protein